MDEDLKQTIALSIGEDTELSTGESGADNEERNRGREIKYTYVAKSCVS